MSVSVCACVLAGVCVCVCVLMFWLNPGLLSILLCGDSVRRVLHSSSSRTEQSSPRSPVPGGWGAPAGHANDVQTRNQIHTHDVLEQLTGFQGWLT